LSIRCHWVFKDLEAHKGPVGFAASLDLHEALRLRFEATPLSFNLARGLWYCRCIAYLERSALPESLAGTSPRLVSLLHHLLMALPGYGRFACRTYRNRLSKSPCSLFVLIELRP
jgi:hypothetical protein